LKGDTNKDGIIDSGEKTDYDGDGIPPYNNSTGVFDEDDWGRVDIIEDNYNVLYSQVPSSSGQSYILFDKNLYILIEKYTTFSLKSIPAKKKFN
jgi:hypothetical protein